MQGLVMLLEPAKLPTWPRRWHSWRCQSSTLTSTCTAGMVRGLNGGHGPPEPAFCPHSTLPHAAQTLGPLTAAHGGGAVTFLPGIEQWLRSVVRENVLRCVSPPHRQALAWVASTALPRARVWPCPGRARHASHFARGAQAPGSMRPSTHAFVHAACWVDAGLMAGACGARRPARAARGRARLGRLVLSE